MICLLYNDGIPIIWEILGRADGGGRSYRTSMMCKCVFSAFSIEALANRWVGMSMVHRLFSLVVIIRSSST